MALGHRLPPPAHLRALVAAIEQRSTASPGRALPHLRAALATAAATPRDPTAPAPTGEPTPTPADSAGAWATAARASSQYRATDYGAWQATGAPNVARHGDSAKAWAPKVADAGEEWLELDFAAAVHATEIHVVQSLNPGAITRIDVIDATGSPTTVWTGPDATPYAKARVSRWRACGSCSTRRRSPVGTRSTRCNSSAAHGDLALRGPGVFLRAGRVWVRRSSSVPARWIDAP